MAFSGTEKFGSRFNVIALILYIELGVWEMQGIGTWEIKAFHFTDFK